MANVLEVRVEQTPGILNWNFEELSTLLDQKLEKYRGLQIAEEDAKEAKEIRADLNRLAKAINDRKISVKKEFCAPYTEFETQAKKLIDKVKEVSNGIDVQIKAYEERAKLEKREAIEAYWKSIDPQNIDIDMIFDSKWLNATCSEKEWKSALDQTRWRIRQDIATLSEFEDQTKRDWCITEYMKTLDTSATLRRWDEQKQAEERARAAKEELAREQAAREEEARKRAEMAAQQEVQKPKPAEPEESKAEDPRDYLYSPTFQLIDLTYDEAMDLTRYMQQKHLTFRSIAKERRKK